MLRALQPLIPPALHSWVHAVVTEPQRMTSVTALALHLGVHRKTLVNRCMRLGFLSPAELIAWCRLCVVAYQLKRSSETVELIALNLEYPSHTALRNRLKRYTGMKAMQLRQTDGLAAVVNALRHRLGAQLRTATFESAGSRCMAISDREEGTKAEVLRERLSEPEPSAQLR